jgi:integrase
MPNADLSAAFVRNAVCPEGKSKINFFDNAITGFMLEVRSTGGKTYALRYRDSRGRQKQVKISDTKSVTFDRVKAAAEKLRSRVVLSEDPAEEKKIKRAIPTIQEAYASTYLPLLQQTRRNMQSDLSFWKVHLMPKFGHKHLDELTRDDVVGAQQSMRKAGFAAGTANKWIVQIRYLYNVLKKAKIPGSEINPAAGLKQYRVEGRERFLSSEETERLRIAVERSENTQLKYFVALSLMLGSRKMELLKAKFADFDLERRTWKIPISKSGKMRHVPLSTASIAVLRSLPRWDGVPWILPNPHTLKPFTHLNESWKTATVRAGLEGFRIHDLRHSFASNLVNAGHSLFVVSKALGHANIQQTSRYSHLSDDTLLAAADAAADAIGANWTKEKKSPA